MALMVAFAGCRTVKYVPVETIRVETVDRNVYQRDSIYVSDSITVREKGDTVFIDRWRKEYIDRWRDSIQYVTKTDSIPYRVEVPVEVNRLTGWQNFQVYLGRILMLIVVIGAVWWKIKH